MYYISYFLLTPEWFESFVSSLDEVSASLAFPTLSLLNSNGMKFGVFGRVIITVVRKCSETVVGLEMLDNE